MKRPMDTMPTDWTAIGTAIASARLPRGYRFELLRRREIRGVIDALARWFPDIAVGSASCYLREAFFAEDVVFPDAPEKDVLVVLIRKQRELAGIFSCERDAESLALYARLGVVAPGHRGLGLAHAALVLAEAIGRQMKMGMVYAMATLKVPHVQRAFETLDWQLIGIAPGLDRELVAPGVVKRVYEAVYAKVLVAHSTLLRPRARNMTARTRAFFNALFPSERLEGV